jgi:hypothetical protein
MSADDDTYTAPEHGWTCYHCGQTFMVPAQAAIHFGSPNAKPGCMMRIKRGEEYSLLLALQMVEQERDELALRLLMRDLLFNDEMEDDVIRRFRFLRGILGEMYEIFKRGSAL